MSDQATRLRKMAESRRPGHGGSPPAVVPPSIPTGVVSYRPRPQRRRTVAEARHPVKLARAIAVTSGKGGVGKSNLAVNLAVALSGLGYRICLLDADLGLANADVLCNLTPRLTLQHVVTGKAKLAEVMLLAPGGFRLIPGASGVAGMADLGSRHRETVLRQLAMLEQVADVIIIDCAAGISANVLAFAAAAHRTLVATTPEPTAVTDAYGMVKSLLRCAPGARAHLVVNMARDDEEARGVHARMNRVTSTFLKRSIDYAGAIPLDPAVAEAVRYRLPFTLYAPDGAATAAVRAIAGRLVGVEPAVSDPRRRGFFARVASLLGKSREGERFDGST